MEHQHQPQPLKYLFECHFSDNTFIRQSPDNKPKFAKEGTSFTDVVLRMDDVTVFGLFDAETNEQVALVDLRNATFQIGNRVFLAGEPNLILPPDAKLKLIYFRTTRLHHQGHVITGVEPEIYYIGFQVNIDGKAYKQTIAIN